MLVGTTRIGPESAVLFGIVLFLAVNHGKSVPRARIRSLFWPDASDARASHSLRQLLYRLQQIGVGANVTSTDVTLDSGRLDADFTRFRGSSTEGHGVSRPDAFGPFLPHYTPDFSAQFAAWVDGQRQIVHGYVRAALLTDIASRRASGDWAAVERLARRVLEIDPLNEEGTLCLAEAKALAGSKAEAVALLDSYAGEIGGAGNAALRLSPAVLRRRIAELPRESPTNAVLEGEFVGRAQVMAAVHQTVNATRGGSGRSICLWGPEGIGKTRLIDEFAPMASLLGIRMERIACHRGDRQRPMSVFSQLAQQLINLPGALGCEPSSYDYLRRLAAPNTTSVALSPEAAHAGTLAANIRRALYDVLDAVSSERILVIAIEDFHWADEQSVALLEEMVVWTQSRRIALIITSRTHPIGPRFTDLLFLQPLDALAVETLARSLLPAASPPPAELFETWLRYSEGNPFYVRELVAHWRATHEADSIPPSLSVLLRQRLSALTEVASRALQTIAVLGRNCTVSRLERALQLPNHELIAALEELERSRLISGRQQAVTCSHDMISRAITEPLSPITFRALHRLAALTLESETRSGSPVHVIWDCTRHWELAGDPGRGLALTIECSTQLLELGLPTEASSLLTSARQLATTPEQLALLLDALAQALYHAGLWRDLHGVLQERKIAAPFPEAAHDDQELLFVEAAWRGHDRDYARLLHRVTRCVEAPGASASHRLRAASQGIRIAADCFERAQAEHLYSIVTTIPADSHTERAALAEIETVYHTTFGDLGRGADAARHLISLCRAEGKPAHIARALRFASAPYRLAGKVSDAEAALLESLAISTSHHLLTAQIQSAYRLGAHYLALGRPDLTLAMSTAIASLDSKQDDALMQSTSSLLAVQAQLALGDAGSAKQAYSNISTFDVADGLSRAATEFVAVKVRMQLEGYPADISQVDVERLLHLHVRGRAMGAEDFAAGTLFRALFTIGRESLALELFTEYVSCHRRDRIPFEHELADFIALAGVAIASEFTGSALGPRPAFPACSVRADFI